ncbi:MAG: hypothetical protein FH751_15535 [Firmicutes bacterium]|nr:hypothetical protein [Bacillota bacterium]
MFRFKKVIFLIFLIVSIILISIVFLRDDKVKNVVKRDLIMSDSNNLNNEMLSSISKKGIIVLGEYHGVKEHHELLKNLAIELNKKNYNTLLIETPQAWSWIYEDYTTGNISEVDEIISKRFRFYTANLKDIRKYNINLPEKERLRVKTIDINHNPYYYITSLEFMVQFIENKEPIKILIKELKENVEDEENYKKVVLDFNNNLKKYKSKFSSKWYNRLNKMTDIEIKSIKCRKYLKDGKRKSRYIERENIIKSLVEDNLKITDKLIINVGANHAQKKPFRGTKHEWIGEYLSYKSSYAKDNTYCLLVIPKKGKIQWGSFDNHKSIDITKSSDNAELFKIIAETSKDKIGFLLFNDQIFENEKMPLNFYYNKIKIKPKKQYDGVIVIPKANVIKR